MNVKELTTRDLKEELRDLKYDLYNLEECGSDTSWCIAQIEQIKAELRLRGELA
jgi:hypothetical protein